MAAIVCHGFQSCLESQLVESRINSLRLPSPKPLTPQQSIDIAFHSCCWESNIKPNCEENSYKTDINIHPNPITFNPNRGGWNSIQDLPSGPKELTYVPPQLKCSLLRLSPRSLELCTENLGNETGTDIIHSGNDLLSSLDCDDSSLGTREQRKSRELLGAKKTKAKNFPPPLTTIRGSESIQVRSHREGGRLVIEATKVPSSASCFQAERGHGRLRLSLWTDPEDDDDDNQGFEEEFETEKNGQRQEVEDKEEEEEEEGECVELETKNENEDGACGVCEETKGKSWTIWGGNLRMEKYERPSRSRCKEGDHENNELLVVNWGEPLWVTTSKALIWISSL